MNVEAPDSQGKGRQSHHLNGSAGVGPGDQVIQQHQRGIQQKQQPGQPHIMDPQCHGGHHHGAAQQQAVGTVPGQQRGYGVAHQEEYQPQGAFRPFAVVAGADHGPPQPQAVDECPGPGPQQAVVDHPQHTADHLQGQYFLPAAALQGCDGDDGAHQTDELNEPGLQGCHGIPLNQP